ncbi:MAG: DUF1700 domain-containing protein [Lachnospiraceae bacterium]|nr:DUF1700 domain-containing protein [Lachnospiraceae bacterium]
MTKFEFLTAVRSRLYGLPAEDVQRSLDYFAEMIDDHIEDGMSEEEAVAAIGTPDEAAASILGDVSLTKIVATKIKPKRQLHVWEIVLLVLFAPVLFGLAVAAVALIFSGYVTVFSIAIATFSCVLAFSIASIACIIYAPYLIVTGSIMQGLCYTGFVLIFIGLAILFFHLTMVLGKASSTMIKKMMTGLKRVIVGKKA